MWWSVSGFMIKGLVSRLCLANCSDSGSFLEAHTWLSQDRVQWEGFWWGGGVGSETVQLRMGLEPCARTQIWPKPRLGLESMTFKLRSHTWSQDLMKFAFLMSCCRMNSVRNSDMSEVDLIRKTYTPQSGGHVRGKRPWNMVWLSFMWWVISQAN